MRGNIYKLRILFTSLIIVYPILSVYYSGFSSLTVADVLLLFLLVPIFLHYFRSKKLFVRKAWIPFFLFLLIQFFVLNLSGVEDYGIMRIFRYMLYYIVIASGSADFFDIDYGYKALRNVSLFVSIFGIVQAIGIYIFGFYIPGVLKFLPVMREDLLTYGENYISGTLRVRSVFSEPAHLAAYLGVYLVICLFSEKHKNIKDAILVSVCLIFSVSSTAYYMLLFVGGVFLFKTVFETRETSMNKFIMGIIALVIVTIGVIVLLQSEMWEMFWNRNFVTGDSIGGRFNGYEVFEKIYTTNDLYMLCGHGYADYGSYVNSFLASIPLLYWYMGYIGLGLFIFVFVREFMFCKDFTSRMLILLIGILGLATQIFVSYNLMLYAIFAVSISNAKHKGISNNEKIC